MMLAFPFGLVRFYFYAGALPFHAEKRALRPQP
jgi:hypothetical protein